MRHHTTFLLLAVLFCTGCETTKHFNAHINDPRSVESLRSDVDFAHHKLEKLHPSLYRYISKQDLDYKFDSLKSTLEDPMTSREFFFKLSPVIASVRQGHARLFQIQTELRLRERFKVLLYGTSPVNKLPLGWFNNQLYLVGRTPLDTTLLAGTEIVSIDSICPQAVFTKYRPTFSSDGFNTTFQDRLLVKRFAQYQYLETGIRDSVLCRVKSDSIERDIWLKQPRYDRKKNKDSTQVSFKTKRIQGFDTRTQNLSKTLRFATPDSSVAILTIRDFSRGYFRSFYKESFRIIDSVHSKALIIDVRNNTGGNINDIRTLYSYLAQENFHLVTAPVVTSKTSLWRNPFSNIGSPFQMAFQILLLPGNILYDAISYIKTKKGADGKYHIYYPASWEMKPKPNRFNGKVYVLINGCSFSASSILSANLKGSGRATFVGEETGGSSNSCVAGSIPAFKLPGSKLWFSFGLLEISSPYTFTPDGRGIMPDVEIKPTLEELVKGVDPELQRVLNTLNGK
jgi:hypothetical protein